jgi:hypothetical protein
MDQVNAWLRRASKLCKRKKPNEAALLYFKSAEALRADSQEKSTQLYLRVAELLSSDSFARKLLKCKSHAALSSLRSDQCIEFSLKALSLFISIKADCPTCRHLVRREACAEIDRFNDQIPRDILSRRRAGAGNVVVVEHDLYALISPLLFNVNTLESMALAEALARDSKRIDDVVRALGEQARLCARAGNRLDAADARFEAAVLADNGDCDRARASILAFVESNDRVRCRQALACATGVAADTLRCFLSAEIGSLRIAIDRCDSDRDRQFLIDVEALLEVVI